MRISDWSSDVCYSDLRQVYMDLYHFWLKVFSVAFGMGVVSGLVMAYQFGTNWSEFSRFAGGITGPLLTYEVLTAFFLEAGLLCVMLFGLKRFGPGLHRSEDRRLGKDCVSKFSYRLSSFHSQNKFFTSFFFFFF